MGQAADSLTNVPDVSSRSGAATALRVDQLYRPARYLSKERGLTGTQSVLIPKANVQQHLMLTSSIPVCARLLHIHRCPSI